VDENAIYAALTEIFHDIFGDATIALHPQTVADDVSGWDSFTTVNLIVAVERRFGFKVRNSEFRMLQSVGDFVALITAKSVAGAARSLLPP
jgi:acyl carrier protein